MKKSSFLQVIQDIFSDSREAITKGDLITKLSLVIFGLGSALRGQIIKGVLYFLIELAYIIYFFSTGFGFIGMLPSLGKATQQRIFNETTQIYDITQGDNSMQILLFGVLSIFLLVFLVATALKSCKAAYAAQVALENKKAPSTFTEDLKGMLDGHLQTTVLSLPAFGAFAFTILPLIFMICMAFTNFDRDHQPPGNLFTWVGFDNFKAVFYENPQWSTTFLGILGWTLIWAFFATFTNYILGMILAILINQKGLKLKKMWRTFFVSTIAVPQFVSLLLMQLVLQDTGPLNILLRQIGLVDAQSFIPFLTDGNVARVTVIIVNIWVGVPYTMLITTGILMNIPEDMYESARIDGANPLQMFMSITLPHMLFVTTPYLITTFIGNINNFNVIYFLTGGGPPTLSYYQAGKTDLLVTWLYKLTVNEQNYSLASTIGILVFVFSATMALVSYNRSASVQREGEFS
ncbi:MAG: sugar ABC transporter permease [Clostridiales bacterium]|jgi:arabinogalactan oligomer/maltooligosaccharide transport system permease protein|nr:sugar ABC transporter permease [Clostridiales bacterium]